MSVVTSIRDYVEVLNTQIGVSPDPVSLFSVSSETFPYIFKMCKETFWDFFSFKGFRDNFYRPYLGGLEDVSSIKVFIETQFSDSKNTFSQIFGFLLTGFGNSFFVSLPGSIGTLIITRRIILQGVPAGMAATLGSVLASCCTMVFVTVGGRFLVISPAFLEIFYFLGIIIPGYVVVRGLLDSYFRIIPETEKRELFWIGFMHFLLGASNQSTLFKHIRDLTLLPYPTRFLGISDGLSQIFYILGFCAGSLIFAFGAFYAAVYLIDAWLSWSTMTRSRLMSLSNWTSIVILISLNLSILSYYGTDFLVTKAVGFLPNDKALWHTSLAPNTLLKDPGTALSKDGPYPSLEFSLDPSTFDRPLQKLYRTYHLLKQPTDFKYRSFEELNYQGEKHWLHRIFRHGSIKPNKDSTIKQTDNKSGGRAVLRSLDRAIGWVDEDKNLQISPKEAFTNLAKEDISFDFTSPLLARADNEESVDNMSSLEQRFKRYFFGQIGLIPGRLPPTPYGPFDTQEMAHKRLAFTNPVYKALLSFDIDLFLKRQPPNHSLSTQDEHNLFLKRQLLERYINTKRDYFDNNSTENNSFDDFGVYGLPCKAGTSSALDASSEENPPHQVEVGAKEGQFALQGFSKKTKSKKTTTDRLTSPIDEGVTFIKSLANQTYKHQFKGTLEIVRQMFAVSLDCPNPSSLAGGGAWETFISGGEGFFEDDRGLATPRPKNPRILKFDQPLYTLERANVLDFKSREEQPYTKRTNTKHLHEELLNSSYTKDTETEFIVSFVKEARSKALQTEGSPFLEPVSVAPFYAGWDNQRRQLLLTQRYLPRKDTMVFKQPQTVKSESSFATWPIPELERGDFLSPNWRVPSRSDDQMKPPAFAMNGKQGEDEDNNEEIPLNEEYQRFVEVWKKKILLNNEPDLPSKMLNKNFSNDNRESKEDYVFSQEQWPFNILYTQDLEQLENFDLLQAPYFVGVKRGGFVWPGGYKSKLRKN